MRRDSRSNVPPLSSKARHAAQAKDWATVEECAKQIQLAWPADPEGHFLSGLVHKAARHPRKAIDAFQKAITLDPRRYDAAVELAGQYSIARQNGEAAKLLAKYERLLGNSPRYLDMAGTIYTEIGLADRAWALYEKANQLQPGIDLFQANMAACAVYLGRIDDARELYQLLLKRFPAHQRNHYHLSRLQTASDDSHVRQMLELLHRSHLRPEQNVFLYYAIAKELEDLERWDEAFGFYRMAGNAVMRVAKYDLTKELRLIDTIIKACNADWLSKPVDERSSVTAEPTPVFIVGLPRSGTTLTERILSSHSHVESLNETLFMQMVIREESGVPTVERMTPEVIEAAVNKDVHLIAEGYRTAVQYRLTGKPMFIDKLPLNYLYLGFIAKGFPGAKIVHVRRNPMDICFAMYKQAFTWAYKFSYSLDNIGRYYLAYCRLWRHWKEVLGERVIDIEYERLVSDQERQTRALLDKLGLAFESSCLNFEENRTPSTTASSVQVRNRIHARSVLNWTHFRRHLEPLQRMLEEAGIDPNKG